MFSTKMFTKTALLINIFEALNKRFLTFFHILTFYER